MIRNDKKLITSILDLGDATLARPKATALGGTGQMTSFKPDRPFLVNVRLEGF